MRVGGRGREALFKTNDRINRASSGFGMEIRAKRDLTILRQFSIANSMTTMTTILTIQLYDRS